MSAPVNPYALPAVLVLEDVARALRTSVTTIRRSLRAGTFPIPTLSSPIRPTGLDKRYRWARRDVEAFLNGGYQAHQRRQVRLSRTA